jgi:hypothetical protein
MAAVVLAVFGLSACGEEDDPTGPQTATEQLTGTWVSAGADVAPGFAPFSVDSIIATFNENQTYRVEQYAGGGAQPVVLTGTFETGDAGAGAINSITLTQGSPTQLTAAGIYQITGDDMTYEVIQIEPAIGATAPTVAGGFGSTTVGGTQTDVWIQQYDRVDQ